MNKQKQLWDKLAKKNSRYYINSDKGKGIDEGDFILSGFNDYHELVVGDNLITNCVEFDKGTILDLGCGTGRMTCFMLAYFKRVIGIDISSEMIKQAKERLKCLWGFDRVELIGTDGETIPLKDNSVDIVFSYLVFQHMKTKKMVEANFKEVYRVLKPGGIFKLRLRIDKLDSLDPWWAGVSFDEREAYSLSWDTGFNILRSEIVEDYGLWLWLEKKI